MIWVSRTAQCELQLCKGYKGCQARIYVCSQISRQIIGSAFLLLKEQSSRLIFQVPLQHICEHKDLHASYNYDFGLWDVYPLTLFCFEKYIFIYIYIYLVCFYMHACACENMCSYINVYYIYAVYVVHVCLPSLKKVLEDMELEL